MAVRGAGGGPRGRLRGGRAVVRAGPRPAAFFRLFSARGGAGAPRAAAAPPQAMVKWMAVDSGKGYLEMYGPDLAEIVEFQPPITPQNARIRERSPFR